MFSKSTAVLATLNVVLLERSRRHVSEDVALQTVQGRDLTSQENRGWKKSSTGVVVL